MRSLWTGRRSDFKSPSRVTVQFAAIEWIASRLFLFQSRRDDPKLAQGGAHASFASVRGTLGDNPTQTNSPNGAALTNAPRSPFGPFLEPPLRGSAVNDLRVPGLRDVRSTRVRSTLG